MIPVGLFTIGLWAAYALVGVGASYLLAVLVREWREGELW